MLPRVIKKNFQIQIELQVFIKQLVDKLDDIIEDKFSYGNECVIAVRDKYLHFRHTLANKSYTNIMYIHFS